MSELRWIGQAGSQAGAPAVVVSRRKSRERLAWGIAAGAIAALALLGGMQLRRQRGDGADDPLRSLAASRCSIRVRPRDLAGRKPARLRGHGHRQADALPAPPRFDRSQGASGNRRGGVPVLVAGRGTPRFLRRGYAQALRSGDGFGSDPRARGERPRRHLEPGRKSFCSCPTPGRGFRAFPRTAEPSSPKRPSTRARRTEATAGLFFSRTAATTSSWFVARRRASRESTPVRSARRRGSSSPRRRPPWRTRLRATCSSFARRLWSRCASMRDPSRRRDRRFRSSPTWKPSATRSRPDTRDSRFPTTGFSRCGAESRAFRSLPGSTGRERIFP